VGDALGLFIGALDCAALDDISEPLVPQRLHVLVRLLLVGPPGTPVGAAECLNILFHAHRAAR